jgi:hypothetical protein
VGGDGTHPHALALLGTAERSVAWKLIPIHMVLSLCRTTWPFAVLRPRARRWDAVASMLLIPFSAPQGGEPSVLCVVFERGGHPRATFVVVGERTVCQLRKFFFGFFWFWFCFF